MEKATRIYTKENSLEFPVVSSTTCIKTIDTREGTTSIQNKNISIESSLKPDSNYGKKMKQRTSHPIKSKELTEDFQKVNKPSLSIVLS